MAVLPVGADPFGIEAIFPGACASSKAATFIGSGTDQVINGSSLPIQYGCPVVLSPTGDFAARGITAVSRPHSEVDFIIGIAAAPWHLPMSTGKFLSNRGGTTSKEWIERFQYPVYTSNDTLSYANDQLSRTLLIMEEGEIWVPCLQKDCAGQQPCVMHDPNSPYHGWLGTKDTTTFTETNSDFLMGSRYIGRSVPTPATVNNVPIYLIKLNFKISPNVESK